MIEQFNMEARAEIEEIRDFIVLHYNTTQRDDTPFWRYCKDMKIPETLSLRKQLFSEAAHALPNKTGLFRVEFWVFVMLGQRLMPESYHPTANVRFDDRFQTFMDDLKSSIKNDVAIMPTHQQFLNRYCPANVDVWGKQKK